MFFFNVRLVLGSLFTLALFTFTPEPSETPICVGLLSWKSFLPSVTNLYLPTCVPTYIRTYLLLFPFSPTNIRTDTTTHTHVPTH